MSSLRIKRSGGGEPVGVGQGSAIVSYRDGVRVRLGRALFSLRALGYERWCDFREEIMDETLDVGYLNKLLVARHGCLMVSGESVILEDVELFEDRGPPRRVPAHWMAL